MELKGHNEIVCSILWNPNNNIVYTAGIDTFILIWDQVKRKNI